MPRQSKVSPPSQHDEFVRVAREIGADDDEASEKVMRRLAQQPKTERKPLKKKKVAK